MFERLSIIWLFENFNLITHTHIDIYVRRSVSEKLERLPKNPPPLCATDDDVYGGRFDRRRRWNRRGVFRKPPRVLHDSVINHVSRVTAGVRAGIYETAPAGGEGKKTETKSRRPFYRVGLTLNEPDNSLAFVLGPIYSHSRVYIYIQMPCF